MTPRPSRLALGLLLLLPATASFAQSPPPPITPTLFSFPGAFATPPNARTAGVALANRWIGDAPFENPAFAAFPGVELSPLLMRVSRQDLRRQNRNFDEEAAFFDAAGAWGSYRMGRVAIAGYGYQPVLRLENNAYTQGTQVTAQPATMQTNSSQREWRAGLALACSLSSTRLGAAIEYTQRMDRYKTLETSGSPTSGTTTTDFSGGGVGAQFGVHTTIGKGGAGTTEVGGGARFVPSISLEGEVEQDLLVGLTTTATRTERSPSWEGGVSVRVKVTPAFRALAAFGGHGDQDYEDFGVSRGKGSFWSIGGEYHDARDPWNVGFGYGTEEETKVPEPRASVVGIGFGWDLESTRLELGITHRSVQRAGQPNSELDEVVLSVLQAF